jgi:hypothetical protein
MFCSPSRADLFMCSGDYVYSVSKVGPVSVRKGCSVSVPVGWLSPSANEENRKRRCVTSRSENILATKVDQMGSASSVCGIGGRK